MNEVSQVYLEWGKKGYKPSILIPVNGCIISQLEKKQHSKVIQSRLFASLFKQITLLLSTCEQSPGTHSEQGLAVTKFNVYVFPRSTFKMPTSWIISNLTRDVVRKITCQVDLVVVASQR